MPIDRARIAELEKALEEARVQLLKEDGERYRVLMREISDGERERIFDTLTDKRERVLFGLDAPEKLRHEGKTKPGASGGDMTCSICGKSGLTKRGLGLHTVRLHKDEMPGEAEEKVPEDSLL